MARHLFDSHDVLCRTLPASVGVVLSLSALSSIACAGSVTGTVLDGASPAADARISISGTSKQATTDGKGHFVVKDVPQGHQTIQAILLDGRQATDSVAVSQSGTSVVSLSVPGSGEFITVRGAGSTIQRGLSEQQHNIGVTNILTSEQIAQVPVSSVADLASQIPGLSQVRTSELQASTGEGQYVTIRGLDAAYNAYSLNGIRLPQTDADSRAVSMNLFSPFGLASIAVDKTPTSSSDGDNIAGDINLRTPSAFDFGADQFFKADVQGELAQQALDLHQPGLGGAAQLQGAKVFGADRQFGVYASFYYENKFNTAEEIANQNPWVVDNDKLPGTARDNEGNLVSNGIQWNLFRNDIKRYGANLSLDYHGDTTQLYWRNIFAYYEDDNTQDEQSLITELVNNPTTQYGPGIMQVPLADVKNNYNTTTGAWQPLGIQPGHYFQYNEFVQELASTQLGGTTRLGSDLSTHYDASYAYGEYDNPIHYEGGVWGVPYIGTAGAGSGVANEGLLFDYSNPKSPSPILSPGAAAYLYNPASLHAWNDDFYRSYTHVGLITLHDDVTWDVGNRFLKSITVGAKYEVSNRDADNGETDNNTRTYLGVPGVDGDSAVTPQFYQGKGPNLVNLPGSFIPGILGYPGAFKVVDVNYYRHVYGPLEAVAPNNPTLSEIEFAHDKVSGTESRYAGFIDGTLTYGKLTIVPGLRWELNTDDFRSYNDGTIAAGFQDVNKSYYEILPGVLATYRPTANTVLRGAIRKSYARPAFDQIFGTRQVTQDPFGNITINEPNPNLKPVTSVNYDVGADYYDQHGGVLQIDAYYKDLSNVLYSIAASNTTTGQTSATTSGVTTLETTTNGLTGTAAGLEFNVRKQFRELIAPLDGFGFAGNLTLQRTHGDYNSGDGIRSGMLPGAPNVLYNLSLFYDRSGLKADLNYHYQGLSLYALQVNDPDTYLQSTTSLDFSASYTFQNGLSAGFAAANLLDSYTYWATEGKSKRYVASNLEGGYLETGRTFLVNLSYRL